MGVMDVWLPICTWSCVLLFTSAAFEDCTLDMNVVVQSDGLVCARIVVKRPETGTVSIHERQVDMTYSVHEQQDDMSYSVDDGGVFNVSLSTELCFAIITASVDKSLHLCGHLASLSHARNAIRILDMRPMTLQGTVGNRQVECPLFPIWDDMNGSLKRQVVKNDSVCHDHDVMRDADRCLPTCATVMEGSPTRSPCKGDMTADAFLHLSMLRPTDAILFPDDRLLCAAFHMSAPTDESIVLFANPTDTLSLTVDGATHLRGRANDPYPIQCANFNPMEMTPKSEVFFCANLDGSGDIDLSNATAFFSSVMSTMPHLVNMRGNSTRVVMHGHDGTRNTWTSVEERDEMYNPCTKCDEVCRPSCSSVITGRGAICCGKRWKHVDVTTDGCDHVETAGTTSHMTETMKMTVTEEDITTRVTGDATERRNVTSAREHLHDAGGGAILTTEAAVHTPRTSTGPGKRETEAKHSYPAVIPGRVFSSSCGIGQTAMRILTVSMTTVVLCSILL